MKKCTYRHFTNSAGNDALVILTVGFLLHWISPQFTNIYLNAVVITIETLCITPLVGGIVSLYAVIKSDGRISGIGAFIVYCLLIRPGWFWSSQNHDFGAFGSSLYENASLVLWIT